MHIHIWKYENKSLQIADHWPLLLMTIHNKKYLDFGALLILGEFLQEAQYQRADQTLEKLQLFAESLVSQKQGEWNMISAVSKGAL